MACQPCNCYLLPVSGFHHKPPLCKGRWHFREKMTEGLSRKSALSLPANFSKRHNPSPASQELPLHKGAFPIMAPSTKSPHPLFLFTGNSLFRTTLLTRGFRNTKRGTMRKHNIPFPFSVMPRGHKLPDTALPAHPIRIVKMRARRSARFIFPCSVGYRGTKRPHRGLFACSPTGDLHV